ncbi:hypothetical protein [Legionella maioricensis]|uniref:Uncharacterized protein n=1 Tax=Legionella maioricensis TaxID=2896528 RepID=A0A9X2D038_9GAMM|nr:hypothetical protein [Legionella maioricensis]MCL9683953.1 hypothetical protein [Legionella maioricensis]MCL9688281.1 hypothetical protein [Legionella maioricensis]
MTQFKFLKIKNFEYQLKTYNQVASSIQKDVSHLESKKNINILTADEARDLEFYTRSLAILIESTFLQLYAELEEALYDECEKQSIKKNASISRFETALQKQGNNIDNEHWNTLLHISKIRNCLLHGNGRLDGDRYGMDTTDTINSLNSDASTALIEIINLQGHREGISKIKLNEKFLNYCFIKIKNFIGSQE